MNAARLCRLIPAPLMLWATLAVPTPFHAQSAEATDAGKVLVIEREFTKPGRDGASHEATEAAYVRAMKAGNGKMHYVAVASITGPSRALFISSYPSFAAMEAERKSMSPALATALDKAGVADGDVLSATDASILLRRDDLSTNISGPPVGTRMMEVSQYVIKPGHMHEWTELAKMYVDAAKSIPEMHWTTFEIVYGHTESPTFVVFTALKSGAEADAEFAAGKRFDDAIGEEGHKKMAALEAACVQGEMTNLFAVNAKMSIPTEDMVASEPDFWRPKATATGMKKHTAAKPEAATGQ
jgi:hypothetical protein